MAHKLAATRARFPGTNSPRPPAIETQLGPSWLPASLEQWDPSLVIPQGSSTIPSSVPSAHSSWSTNITQQRFTTQKANNTNPQLPGPGVT